MSDELEEIPTLVPWERQPSEEVKTFSYFAHYRDLGPTRSLAKAARNIGVDTTTMERHSRHHGWVERAAAYDDHVDRLFRQAKETRQIEAAERAADVSAAILTHVALRLRGGQTVDEEGQVRQILAIDPNEMTYGEVGTLTRVATVGEREALGMPTAMLKATTGTVSMLDYQKLAKGMWEISLRHIPEERQARYAAEVEQAWEEGF